MTDWQEFSSASFFALKFTYFKATFLNYLAKPSCHNGKITVPETT
jgi:hypothetical protein